MAFQLKRIVGKWNTFRAAENAAFTIMAEADQGASEILSATYDGTTLSDPPFTFTKKIPGKRLVIVFAASDPASVVSFYEQDGADKKLLGYRLGIQKTAVFTIE